MIANCRAIVSMVMLVFAPGGHAAVSSQNDHGFVSDHFHEISASPEQVFNQLLKINEWWDPRHSLTGKADNLVLDVDGQRCFCEKLPGGFVEHLRVIQIDKNRLLRLSGGLGPLQQEAVSGTLSWIMQETPSGTRLTVSYRVSGYVPDGLSGWAAPVDRVIGEQVQRLIEAIGR
ncbi:MAG: ATPase [bacterium]